MDRRSFIKLCAAGGGGVLLSKYSSLILAKPDQVLTASEKTPSPGKWEIYPNTLISGQKTRLEVRYVHGDKPMLPNSYHRLSVEPLSVKSLFHGLPSEDLKVIAYKGSLPKVVLDAEKTHGVGCRGIKLTFPEGLKAGDSFALVMGNDNGKGDLTAIVDPVPMDDIPFPTFSNLTGTEADKKGDNISWDKQPGEVSWFDQSWTGSIPKASIKPASAAALRVSGPSLLQINKKFDLRIAVTDDFDSRAYPEYVGNVTIEMVKGVEGLPSKIAYDASDRCTKVIKGLSISQPGIYRIKAILGANKKTFESNPIVIRESVKEPIYWGNMHNHNCYSECWGQPMDEFYAFARDISGMDFVSISDHRVVLAGNPGRLLPWQTGHEMSGMDSWKDTLRSAQKYYEPNAFVAIPGYEWGTLDHGGFHMNVYYADASADNIDTYFSKKPATVEEMYDLLKNVDALFIPHKHSTRFPYEVLQTTKNSSGYPLTPCVEVYSDWGDSFSPYGTWDINSRFGGFRSSTEHCYLWAIDNGYKLGVISDSDSHTGLPGRRTAASVSPAHGGHSQGVTAVRTLDFTRKGVLQGYQERKTYGTTGEHIFLEVKADDVEMGQTLHTDKPFKFKVDVAGTDAIESISLFNGMTLVEKKTCTSRDCNVVFDCPAPTKQERAFVVLVVQKDGSRAWSTPIWVAGGAIMLKFEVEVY